MSELRLLSSETVSVESLHCGLLIVLGFEEL